MRPDLGLPQGKSNLFVRVAFLGHVGTSLSQKLCPKFRTQIGSVSGVKTTGTSSSAGT